MYPIYKQKQNSVYSIGQIPYTLKITRKLHTFDRLKKPEEVCNKFVIFYEDCVIFITYFCDFPKVYHFSIATITHTP